MNENKKRNTCSLTKKILQINSKNNNKAMKTLIKIVLINKKILAIIKKLYKWIVMLRINKKMRIIKVKKVVQV